MRRELPEKKFEPDGEALSENDWLGVAAFREL